LYKIKFAAHPFFNHEIHEIHEINFRVSAIQALAIETNHEDLKGLKEIFAGCIAGKRFCLLCMGAALRGAASLRESRGKATPAGLVDA
jgi:hypothetical protein